MDKNAASPISDRKAMVRLIVVGPPCNLYAPLEISFAGHASAAQLRLAATQRYPLLRISIIPGIFEIHNSGRAHQISRASSTAASAPPYRLPSLSRNCISRINSSRDNPSSGPTRGSCNGASAIPRRSRIGASHRAIRVQNLHSASKNNHPRACRPFPSVYSLTSEIMAPSFPYFSSFDSSLRASALSSSLLRALRVLCALCVKRLLLFPKRSTLKLSTINRLFPQKRNHLPAQLHHALQRPRRHPDNLLEQSRHRRQKLQHALQPFPRVRIALRIRLDLPHAFRQYIQRRIDLPPLPLFRNDPENIPHVLDRFEVIAPVPQHVYHTHDPPPLQLAQAGTHVRTRHRQRLRNLIRRHRF